jgi:hypothetical protein
MSSEIASSFENDSTEDGKIDLERMIGVGCFATLITGFLMSLLPQAGLPYSDVYVILASLFNTTELSMGSGIWWMAMTTHFIIGGLVFPLLYSIFIYPRMSVAPILRGLTWGAMLWLMNQTFLMPFSGLGFFASAHTSAVVFSLESLVMELIYGAILGALILPEVAAVPIPQSKGDYILRTQTGQPLDERQRVGNF